MMTTTFADVQSKLSACLPNNDVRLQVKQTGNQLSIVINRPAHDLIVDYEAIADDLLAKVREMNMTDLNTVKFYGRPMNSKQIEWQRSESLLFEAASSVVAKPSASPPRMATKPKPALQTYLEQFSHYSNVISAAALLGLLLLLGFNTFVGQKPQAVVWEYRIESVKDIIFTESMNQLGQDGWELVFARRAKESSSDDFAYECIFRRVKKT